MPHSVVADMKCSNSRYFIKIEAVSGYWQCPLNKDSQLPTTFIAPKGHYTCTPVGICSISEHYNRLLDLWEFHVSEESWMMLCIWRHLWWTCDSCVSDSGALSSPMDFLETREIPVRMHWNWILWLYHQPRWWISHHPVLIKAIQEFPCPTNITGLPSFLGLTKQLTDFRKYIAKTTDPLIPLLKPSNAFLWEDCHETAFRSIKEVLSSTPILVYYDPKRMTSLHVDASWLHGLGFVLKQQQFVAHGSCRISFSDRK